MQATKLVLKPDPVRTPVPAVGNQLELLLAKRMVRMCYSQTSSPCGAVEHSCSSVRGKAFCCDSRYVAFVQITQQLELLLRARTPYNRSSVSYRRSRPRTR